MNQLDHIKNNCRICDETQCWLWRGAHSAGFPRVYGPDYAKSADGSIKTVQTGQRAVWQAKTKRAIKPGWRVWRNCNHDHSAMCLNPDHMRCAPNQEHGKSLAESGKWKGQVNRIKAARIAGRGRAKVTPAIQAEILNSPETGRALSKRLQICESSISRARRLDLQSLQPIGGIFSGLFGVTG